MTQYNFCPNCGTSMPKNIEPPKCESCGNVYYRNAKPCASVLPVKDGKVLLAKRGVEPYKGAYDIIGGFMEVDEHPEFAAIREAREETGCEVKLHSLLGTYIDQYGDDGDFTLNLHYIGEIVSGEPIAQDDVAELEWVPINDVPLDGGFQNTRDGLRDLQKWYEAQGQ